VDFRYGGFLEAIFGAKEYGIIKIKNAFCAVADNSPRHSPPPPPNSKRQLGEEWTDFLVDFRDGGFLEAIFDAKRDRYYLNEKRFLSGCRQFTRTQPPHLHPIPGHN
jgi:hypothetical protein